MHHYRRRFPGPPGFGLARGVEGGGDTLGGSGCHTALPRPGEPQRQAWRLQRLEDSGSGEDLHRRGHAPLTPRARPPSPLGTARPAPRAWLARPCRPRAEGAKPGGVTPGSGDSLRPRGPGQGLGLWPGLEVTTPAPHLALLTSASVGQVTLRTSSTSSKAEILEGGGIPGNFLERSTATKPATIPLPPASLVSVRAPGKW